jgi:phosphopentomutase
MFPVYWRVSSTRVIPGSMTALFDKVCILVLDSAGVGAMPDAADFGDAGTNTIGHAAAAAGGAHLPNLARLGLADLLSVQGTPRHPEPRGAFGKMAEASAAKDTIIGHWEMAGVITREAFATFPEGFDAELIESFARRTGRGVLGNKTASGTVILDELGEGHLRSGSFIVYTSADSVFQIAAHEEVVPLDELYAACEIARELCNPIRLARVIARPFVGEPGSFRRTYNRRDFTMPPHGKTLLDVLTGAGVETVGVGKIADIFAHRGVGRDIHIEGDADGIVKTREAVSNLERGLVFTNLVDLDTLYGHRREPIGYVGALQQADNAIPRLLEALGPRGLLAVTADHGCDPTYEAHTDHTREYVPILCGSACFERAVPLGVRGSFADLGATVAEVFGLELGAGESFLSLLNDAAQVST